MAGSVYVNRHENDTRNFLVSSYFLGAERHVNTFFCD
jgi:hypothetical protein